jgi:hypothetical protein
LAVGSEYEIIIDVQYADGAAAPPAGIQPPILQIAVPDSARLGGRVLAEYNDLARNDFLQEPYERLLQQLPARVPFSLTRAPSADDVFHLNLLAYVTYDGKEFFLRRRLALPVRAGASARPVEPVVSDWGVDDKLLQLGDEAAEFDLPRSDGSWLALRDYLGDKNIVVTTYRAFW